MAFYMPRTIRAVAAKFGEKPVSFVRSQNATRSRRRSIESLDTHQRLSQSPSRFFEGSGSTIDAGEKTERLKATHLPATAKETGLESKEHHLQEREASLNTKESFSGGGLGPLQTAVWEAISQNNVVRSPSTAVPSVGGISLDEARSSPSLPPQVEGFGNGPGSDSTPSGNSKAKDDVRNGLGSLMPSPFFFPPTGSLHEKLDRHSTTSKIHEARKIGKPLKSLETSKGRLHGRKCFVTGATSGIGTYFTI